MEQPKTLYDFYTFPENEFFKRAEMRQDEAMAYCVQFDLTMRRARI